MRQLKGAELLIQGPIPFFHAAELLTAAWRSLAAQGFELGKWISRGLGGPCFASSCSRSAAATWHIESSESAGEEFSSFGSSLSVWLVCLNSAFKLRGKLPTTQASMSRCSTLETAWDNSAWRCCSSALKAASAAWTSGCSFLSADGLSSRLPKKTPGTHKGTRFSLLGF